MENRASAEIYGVEVAIDWSYSEDWSTRFAYSFMDGKARDGSGGADPIEGTDPQQRVSVLSSYQLRDNLSLHLFGLYVDGRPGTDIGSYLDIDLGVQWEPVKDLTLSVYGRNLLHDTRTEYRQTFVAPESTQVERQGYLKFNWRF